jgi:ribonuclease G
MTEELLINVGPFQTRIARIEDSRLTEVWVEPEGSESRVGNIYLGRVARVLPSIGGAFVELGLERHGFLPLNERTPGADPLEEGASVIVQVRKDAHAEKGVRLTRRLGLPGRYLVFCPGLDAVLCSRRIADEAEREELCRLVDAMLAEGEGAILRSLAPQASRAQMEVDLASLREVWTEIQGRRAGSSASACLHREVEATLRAIRDNCGTDVSRVLIDSREVHLRAQRYCAQWAPSLVERLVHYDAGQPLFDLYDINGVLEEALRPQVALPSGGRLIIQATEALTAIDVDSGGFVHARDAEQTSLQTNLLAVREITRQVRLRNITGLIVIDFITLDDSGHRSQVVAALRESLTRNRLPSTVGEMSALGLVEVTRKRARPSLGESLTEPCIACLGTGRVQRIEAVASALLQAVRNEARAGARAVTVAASPEVTSWLEVRGFGDDQGVGVAGCRVELQSRADFEREHFDILPFQVR